MILQPHRMYVKEGILLLSKDTYTPFFNNSFPWKDLLEQEGESDYWIDAASKMILSW